VCVARLTDDVVFGKAKRSSAADILEEICRRQQIPQFSLEPIPLPLTLCLRSRIGMYFSAINDRVPVKIFSANFGIWYNQRLLIGHLRGPAPRSVFLTSISDRLTLSAEKNAFPDARGPGFYLRSWSAGLGVPYPTPAGRCRSANPSLCWHPEPGEA